MVRSVVSLYSFKYITLYLSPNSAQTSLLNKKYEILLHIQLFLYNFLSVLMLQNWTIGNKKLSSMIGENDLNVG